MKIFLTMISVLAFTWSCASSIDEGPAPFGLGNLAVVQAGAEPIAIDGAVIDNNGINEVPIVLVGLTNRVNEGIMVTLALAAGVTKHANDSPANTEVEGVLTLMIDDPDGVGVEEIAVPELGRFIVESNSIQYDLIVSGEFAAQAALPPPPTTDELVVTLEGSTPIIEYDGALDYTVSGLTNRNANVIMSIDSYRPVGFEAILENDEYEDPDGLGSYGYQVFTKIIVTERAYSGNRVEYTIGGKFGSLSGVTPPGPSSLTVTFPGSFSVTDPTIERLDVSLEGTDYVVEGLTNRPNEGVTIITDATTFTAGPGFTIGNISTNYVPTSDAGASNELVLLGTFTVTNDNIPGNVTEDYSISGRFAAQRSIPEPFAGSVLATAISLEGSTHLVDRNDEIYTVSRLTNRANEDVIIDLGVLTPPTGFRFTTPLDDSYSPPSGIGAVTTLSEFSRFTLAEIAYTNNNQEYIIQGRFAAQTTINPPDTNQIAIDLPGSSPTVTISGNNYEVAGLTNRHLVNGTIGRTNYSVQSGFTLTETGDWHLQDRSGTGARSSATFGVFTITEDAYPANTETYNVRGPIAAQAFLPSEGVPVLSYDNTNFSNDYRHPVTRVLYDSTTLSTEAGFTLPEREFGNPHDTTISNSFSDSRFEYHISSALSTSNTSAVTVAINSSTNIVFTIDTANSGPNKRRTYVMSYRIREKLYTPNSTVKKYTLHVPD